MVVNEQNRSQIYLKQMNTIKPGYTVPTFLADDVFLGLSCGRLLLTSRSDKVWGKPGSMTWDSTTTLHISIPSPSPSSPHNNPVKPEIVLSLAIQAMACDLDAARIPAMPGEAFYISDFISEEEEAWLLQKVRVFPIYSTSSTIPV